MPPKAVPTPPSVTIIGSGEAFDSGVGNTSYLFQGAGNPSVLFDCGYQVPERLWAKGFHKCIDAVCFTHLHADHSFGIVPLLVRYAEENRKEPLTIIGPQGTEAFVMKLLNMGYPGFAKRIRFPIEFLNLSPKQPLKYRSLTLRAARTVHSVLNHTIRVDGGSSKPFSFAVSGDGQITDETKALTDSVTLLFQEVYGLTPEIPTHADLETIKKWIPTTQIKTIVTAHFSRDQKLKLAKGSKNTEGKKTRWIVAKPGLEIRL